MQETCKTASLLLPRIHSPLFYGWKWLFFSKVKLNINTRNGCVALAMSEKMSELSDKYSHLLSHVKTMSKTAGIPLTDSSESQSSHGAESVHYDSILSLKFAAEVEQTVIHVNETLIEVKSAPAEVRANCYLVGGALQSLTLQHPLLTTTQTLLIVHSINMLYSIHSWIP